MKKTNLKSIKAPWRFLFALCLGLILQSGFNPCKSQNLQFSQVLFVSGTAQVPAGKVWKIEAGLGTTPLPQLSAACLSVGATAGLWVFPIIASGISTTIHSTYNYSTRSTLCGMGAYGTPLTPGAISRGANSDAIAQGWPVVSYPVWLPAMSIVSAIGCSIIEFTVVP